MGRPRSTKPTAKMREALRAIKAFARRRGYYPTVRELAEVLGISPSAAHGRMQNLERLGYIGRPGAGAKRMFLEEQLP